MCTPKPQTGDTLFVDLERPEKVSLFDYFHSIELIPLETSQDALIAGVSKMIVHQNKYYTLDKTQCLIFVFDKTGKFLFKIGTKGQGAGEYSFIQDFTINPFSGKLEILEPYGRIHIYDLSGSFVETKRITYPGFRVAHSLTALDSTTYVSHSMFEPKKILYFILINKSCCMKNLKRICLLVVIQIFLISIRMTGSFSGLFILSFTKWERKGLKSLFNSILGHIQRMVELLFFRKSQKKTSLKEQKKCLINFLT